MFLFTLYFWPAIQSSKHSIQVWQADETFDKLCTSYNSGLESKQQTQTQAPPWPLQTGRVTQLLTHFRWHSNSTHLTKSCKFASAPVQNISNIFQFGFKAYSTWHPRWGVTFFTFSLLVELWQSIWPHVNSRHWRRKSKNSDASKINKLNLGNNITVRKWQLK